MIQEIFEIIDKDNNHDILDLNETKIKTERENILQKLTFNKKEFEIMNKKLKDYRYIEDANHLKHGNFIRWISIKDDKRGKLTNGGVLCNIDIYEEEEKILVMIKSIGRYGKPRFARFNLQHCFVFQRLNYQEQILLKVIDYVAS